MRRAVEQANARRRPESVAQEAHGQSSRVLVVEDDAGLRELLVTELEEHGLAVRGVEGANAALACMEAWRPDLIVSDLRLPDRSGVELLEACRQAARRPPAFVLITAFGSIDQAVDALKRGADDFLTKPLDLDHLRIRVERLLDVQRLRAQVEGRDRPAEDELHGIVGTAPGMRALFDDIRTVAGGRGTILVTGESGVGKELVARAVHRESPRHGGPFVPVNCAGIPTALMESELFGHESGAFTGATRGRAGLFRAAHGGTLLLDEVGELPMELQAKLLRVLQDGMVRRVGANRGEQLDVRVLVATHRNLELEVSEGRFREDLFHRLSTFTLHVPPLRDRREDISLLTARLLDDVSRQLGRSFEGFTPAALEILHSYPFPGNVRELGNVVEHAATFCRGERIDVEDLPQRVRERRAVRSGDARESAHGDRAPDGQTWPDDRGALLPLDELCLRYVEYVLRHTRGNKRRAAALLGIGRRTLYRYLERLGSSRDSET